MTVEINIALEKNELFSGLNDKGKKYIIENSEIRKLVVNKFIYKQGDESDGIYMLLSGSVVITKKRNKRDVINRIVFENDIFGIDEALDGVTRVKGAKAIGLPIRYLFIPNEVVKEVSNIDIEFSKKLFQIVINNLKAVEDRLESFVFKDAKERIIDFIKVNASKTGIQVGLETLVRHPFTQQNIADYTGTSRQTVTTILRDLRSNNKISFQRKRILVRNLAKL